MKTFIRKAVPSDIPRICELEQESFPDPWPKQIFEEVLSHPQQSFYVAVQGHLERNVQSHPERSEGSPLGYIIFWKIIDEVHILNICVEKDQRHKGVGKELLQFCLNYFSRGEVISFSLEVRANNKIAQEFYKKFGFKEAFVRKNYYQNKEDAIVMTLKSTGL